VSDATGKNDLIKSTSGIYIKPLLDTYLALYQIDPSCTNFFLNIHFVVINFLFCVVNTSLLETLVHTFHDKKLLVSFFIASIHFSFSVPFIAVFIDNGSPGSKVIAEWTYTVWVPSPLAALFACYFFLYCCSTILSVSWSSSSISSLPSSSSYS
jgi:hypothetical protein